MSKDVLAATIGGRRMRMIGLLAAAVMAIGLVPWVSAETAQPHGWGHSDDRGEDKFLFFASDGLMQQSVEKYADQGVTPGFRELLKHGARASDDGLLTQAPPNTGAGWFTLATGAWPAVHGSTNNTFHKNGDPFGQTATHPGRTAAFDAGVLQAETLAQAAERGGKKVAQIEWAGGRSGAIDGPTVDFRGFFSGRGVATNYIAPADDAAFTASFGLQFDHPTGFAGRPPFAQAAPTDATGWTNVPPSRNGAAKEMRLRVLDGVNPSWVDKYGLNAYIYDSQNDGRVRYDRVLFSTTKSGDDKVGDLREGEWADVKVKLQTTNALNGKTGAFLVKVERLASDLSAGPPLPHLGDARERDLADVAGRAGLHRQLRGLRGRALPVLAGRRLRRPRGRHRQRGDLHRAGPVLGDRPPPADQVHPRQVQAGPGDGRLPGDRRGPAPVPRARHQAAAERRQQPGLRRRPVQRHAGRPRQAARGVHPPRLPGLRRHHAPGAGPPEGQGPDDVRLVRPRLRAAVPGHRREQGARRPRPARRRPQTSNCRPQSVATGETIGKAKACYAGGALQIYLNVVGPRSGAPATSRSRPPASATEVAADQGRVPGARGSQRLDRRRPAGGLGRDRPRLHEGRGALHPERRRQHRRHVAPDAHRRPGRLLQPAVPVRRGDARHADRALGVLRPARLRAGRAGPRHATPTCGPRSWPAARRSTAASSHDVRSIDLAPTAAFLLDVPVPEKSQGVVRRDLLDDGRQVHADLDRRAERLPRSARPDDARPTTTTSPTPSAARRSSRRCSTRRRTRCRAGRCCWPRATTSAPRRRARRCCRTSRRSTWRTRGGSTPRASATTSSTSGSSGSCCTRSGRTSRSWRRTSSRRHTGETPDWMRTSEVFRVNGIRVGVIGSVVRNTPELVKPGNTAGLRVPRRGRADRARVARGSGAGA